MTKADWPLASFEQPDWHAAIADIIKRRSTNKTDVRDVALRNIELSSARRILDLGCGFGFMSAALAQRVAPDARIVGLDACAANKQSFLKCVTDARRAGDFVCRQIDSQLDWPDDSFDLIVASYSLYFFPDVVPEVARILAPHGLFVALTHMEESCWDLLRAVGVEENNSHLLPVSRNFSAENGDRLLKPWFADVERVDYPNSLAFGAAEHDDLLAYLRFKLPFLSPDSAPGSELPEPLWKHIQTSLSHQGRVVLAKNDAAFRCRKPRCP
ncbi:MAG: class I SAM-dependent methyltransferase [Planctomycetota bacterium]